MFRKFIFNYRIFIWILLILALVMGGGFLVIAFSYNLQKKTESYIEAARTSVSVAKEMENELTAIRGLTFTYLVNKSGVWLDSMKNRQMMFIVHLDRARAKANSPEEERLVQQISALYSNFEQNIITATSLVKYGDISKANALIAHSAQDLISTIQSKSNQYIELNKSAEKIYELEIAKTNSVILKTMVSLGVGGIVAGLLLGWLLTRMLFGPINQLVLTIRGATGEAVLERFKLPLGGELDELGNRVKDLIDRINQANEDLNRNRELLQYSNKYATLGKIAPTIAHEIRNPLAAIKMLVYSIREEHNLPDSIKEDLDIISSEIDRMEGFTKDFLKFAKPADPIFTLVNPTDSLTEVIQLLKPRLKKNSIQLIDNATANKALVMADVGHLKQLYMNIILNAVEVMPKNGQLLIDSSIVLNSQKDNCLEQTEFLRISFNDSGPGIPEAIMKTLFEPFIRGSEQGVGLGLSISQGIATTHGGWISAENKEHEKGAIFHIFLPIKS